MTQATETFSRERALAMRAEYEAASAAYEPLEARLDDLYAALKAAAQPRFVRNHGRGYYAPLSKAQRARLDKTHAAIAALKASGEYDSLIARLNVAATYLQAYKAATFGDAWYTGDL